MRSTPHEILASEMDVRDDGDKLIDDKPTNSFQASTTDDTEKSYEWKIVWRNVIGITVLHVVSIYGGYLSFTSAMWQTNLFAFFWFALSGIGVTGGAHRLWTHRSYKARLPLRILLAFMFTISFQQDIYDWARDHRVHHKYTETDADPHNATRGFFFSHVGWLFLRKHPEVVKKGKMMDLSDLLVDPVVYYQRKYYPPLVLLCSLVLPTMIPMYFWGDTFSNAFLIAGLFRLSISLNLTWLVNSAAHLYGQKPYDININPRENMLVAILAIGEGFHNYHHTFPHDYATSEYGVKYNLTTFLIDTMAWLGLAYDRRTVSKEMIEARKLRTGPTNEAKED